jgi:hypothetical protein
VVKKDYPQHRSEMIGNDSIVKTIDFIRHERIQPLLQSLKAHIELSQNDSLHISSSVLKDIAKRILVIENDVMSLIKEDV